MNLMEFIIANREKFTSLSKYILTGTGMGMIQPKNQPTPKYEFYEMGIDQFNSTLINNLDEFKFSYVDFVDRPRIDINNRTFSVNDIEVSSLNWDKPESLKELLSIEDNCLYFLYQIGFHCDYLTNEILFLRLRLLNVPNDYINANYRHLISQKNRKPKLERLKNL
jgi:hypothetical protein